MNPAHERVRDHMRNFIKRWYFPDTCKITRPQVASIDDSGVVIRDNDLVISYEGSTDIPCRLDITRAFLTERDPASVANVRQYTIDFPIDVDIHPEDRVWVQDNGVDTWFKIRKLNYPKEFDGAIVAVMYRISNTVDGETAP